MTERTGDDDAVAYQDFHGDLLVPDGPMKNIGHHPHSRYRRSGSTEIGPPEGPATTKVVLMWNVQQRGSCRLRWLALDRVERSSIMTTLNQYDMQDPTKQYP